jgi:hypothetical protein
MILYLAGLSTRAMTECYGLIKASREAVRLWVHKLESLAYHGLEGLRQQALDPRRWWSMVSMGE